MPEPSAVEQPAAAAEAQFGRAGRTLTPEQQKLFDEGQRIRTERAKKVSEHSVLESFSPHPPPTEARVRQVNTENTGTERKGGDGPDAGDKTYRGAHERRSKDYRGKIDKWAGLSQELLAKGYDKIEDSPSGFTAVQKKEFLVKEMLEASKSWPAARSVLESFGPDGDPAADAARRELMEEMLRNPKLLNRLTGHFGEIYNGEGAIFEDVVGEAQKEFDIAKAKKEAKEKELASVDARLAEVDLALAKYQPGGVDYVRLNALQAQSARWPRDIDAANGEISRAENDMARLKARQFTRRTVIDYDTSVTPPVRIGSHEELSEDPSISGQISTLESTIERRRSELRDIDQRRSDLEAYTKELDALNKEKTSQGERQAQLGGELGEVEAEYLSKEATLNAQRALRMAQEEEFTNKVEGMVREAGRRFVKEDAQEYATAQKKVAEDDVKKTNDRDEELVLRGMDEKWRREKTVGTFKKSTVQEVDKEAVRGDYERSIRERSMEWFVKESMEAHLNTLTPGSPEYIEERARLDERYKDKDFMDKMSAQAGERLFKNFFESGEKMKGEDVSIIVETKWGKTAIEAGLAKRKEVDELVEKMRQANGFSGSKGEFIKALATNPNAYKKAGIGAAAILALLFGAPFLALGAGALGSGYMALGEASGAPIIG